MLKNAFKNRFMKIIPAPWNINSRVVSRRTASKPKSPLDFEFFKLQTYKPEPMLQETTRVEGVSGIKKEKEKKTAPETEEEGSGSMKYAQSMRKENKTVDAYMGFVEFITHPMTWDRNNGYLNLILMLAAFGYFFVVTVPRNSPNDDQDKEANSKLRAFTKK